MKKILKWAGLVIGIIAIGVFVWQKNHAEPFVPRDFGDVVEELGGDPEGIERYVERLEEAYRNDAYGGDTPEETLNLFIAALKAGDTDLASKYFLLEEQAQMAEELRIGKERGTTGALMRLLERNKTSNPLEGGRYIISVRTDTGVMDVDFLQNPFTKKWKIENL